MVRAGSISAAMAVTLLVGCGGTPGGKDRAANVRLNIGGASFIYPMMTKWAAEYKKAKGGLINYNSIGSGGGIQQMTVKTLDFGCTDAPMTDAKLEEAKKIGGEVVHIPLAMGAVAIAYKLDGVMKPIRFTGPVLADIYLGKLKKWNDKRLQEIQEQGVVLPDADIVVVHRSDGSGTTHIFTDYLAKVSPEWKKKVGVGTSLQWPAGVGMKGSEGVSGHVGRTAGALCYVELTYALQNKISFGAVKNKEGHFILAGLKSVTAAADGSLASIPDDLRYSITDAPGKDSYPIAGTNWAISYVNPPSGKGPAIREFLTWVTHEGQELCEALDYARLPASLVERVEKKLALIK